MCSIFASLFVLCFFFATLVKSDTTVTTPTYEEASTIVHSSEEDLSDENTSVVGGSNRNGSLELVLKMATECETPNHDPGYCIEIKQCEILRKQLANVSARSFIIASKCGPKNEDLKDPKVCCGKFGNYRQVSTHIADDNTVLPKTCGHSKMILHSRILGGVKASLGEFPWMARLLHKNKYGYKSVGCSAFLVHTKYVITAGHCVHEKFLKVRGPVFSVILGEHNTETKVDCNPMRTYCADPLQISRVAKVIVHPGYNANSSGHYNDIAIIHMRKGARITEFVQPICLQVDRRDEISQPYIISGWGRTENGPYSNIKMKLELPAVTQSQCRKKYTLVNIELADTQICAGGEDEKDSCTGDSGGPLMLMDGNIYYAAGVVSYGIGCGMEDWPGIYTSIPSYVPWIKEQMILNSLIKTRSSMTKKNHKNKKHNKKTQVD